MVKPIREHITDTHRPFIFRDPPDHDALRAAVMPQFTRERVQAMRKRADRLGHPSPACGLSDSHIFADLKNSGIGPPTRLILAALR